MCTAGTLQRGRRFEDLVCILFVSQTGTSSRPRGRERRKSDVARFSPVPPITPKGVARVFGWMAELPSKYCGGSGSSQGMVWGVGWGAYNEVRTKGAHPPHAVLQIADREQPRPKSYLFIIPICMQAERRRRSRSPMHSGAHRLRPKRRGDANHASSNKNKNSLNCMLALLHCCTLVAVMSWCPCHAWHAWHRNSVSVSVKKNMPYTKLRDPPCKFYSAKIVQQQKTATAFCAATVITITRAASCPCTAG